MASFLGIGVATLDIINTTDGFPHENSKVRASAQRINRGGNVCNTLAVLDQLGNTCSWSGTLADDVAATDIRADLIKHNINIVNSHTISNGHTPTSYVTTNRLNGSRTIVHYRNLPELSFEHFSRINFSAVDCCHFEGRNIEQTILMLSYLQQRHPNICISVEIEKPRAMIEQLFSYADILFYSQEYMQHQTFQCASDFLNAPSLAPVRKKSMVVCLWGEQGAWLSNPKEPDIHHQAANTTDQAIDTLGAGDTFIAGFLHQWFLDNNALQALQFASQIAAKKCLQTGLNQLVKTL